MTQRSAKRKRTDEAESPPKGLLTSVFMVTRIDYVDDYGRGCGEDPASMSTLGIYASEETARRALEKDQLSYLIERMEDQEMWGDDLAEYWTTTEDGKKELDYDAVEEDLDVLVELIFKGEFIRCKYEWELSEHEIIY